MLIQLPERQPGMPANTVLQNAALTAARTPEFNDDLGLLAVGYLADLTVVDGHPLTNISEIRKMALLKKDGVFSPEELYSALGMAH
jgi:imidazolonepropionase-like amidohydrolase